ncbi:unnamed protein product, partial [Choristocarpus tenellus]
LGIGRGSRRNGDKVDSSLLDEKIELEERRAEQISRVAFKLVREIQRILKAAREAQSLGPTRLSRGGTGGDLGNVSSSPSSSQMQVRGRWAGTEELLALLNGDLNGAEFDERKGQFSSLAEAQAKMSDLVEEALAPEVYGDLCGTLLDTYAEGHPTFVKLCVDAGLPSNLVHCLRVMRVVEFESAMQEQHEQQHEQQQEQPLEEGRQGVEVSSEQAMVAGEGGGSDSGTNAVLSSEKGKTVRATERIEWLLVALCRDKFAGVGEQIKPHLPGLLSLAVSAYPPNGVHVQETARLVVEAIMEGCLNSSMVWLLHYNK